VSETKTRVLILTDEAGVGQVLARALGESFHVETSEARAPSALDGAKAPWDVVLLDFEGSGAGIEAELELVRRINRLEPAPPTVVIRASEGQELTTRLIENGVYDTLAGPPDMVELRLILRRAARFHQAEKELHQLRSNLSGAKGLDKLVGNSPSMQQVFALARRVAPCDVNVLITGETGTGKELLARAIHNLSGRAAGPFVAFSCANLPESLVEDELFGHEKGAFTGALGMRRGCFETASAGTLFLDEIGDLGLGLQPKLLRIIQERAFSRLGSNTVLNANVRLVCATHQNLDEMVGQGRFREDLYYRMNVVQMSLPSLRERREDIPLLAYHFLRQFAQQYGKKVSRFAPRVLLSLEDHTWPGNVRELENVIQRAVVLADGPTIQMWHLPASFHTSMQPSQTLRSYDEEVRDFKRRLILRVLRECGWQKAATARTLGLARPYLHRLISQLQIREEEEEPTPEPLEQIAPTGRPS
jgi:DNA-binding NtrC family response regulator